MSETGNVGGFDIASPHDQLRVRSMAEDMITLPEAELRRLGTDGQAPLDRRIAGKLAQSKQALLSSQWSGRLGIVFAMWGEQRRLQPRSDANPTGEDALHAKLDQLDWLFAGTDVDWRLYPTDDGDPDDSAAVAIDRAAAHPSSDRVQVLRLADGVTSQQGPLATLASVDESRKGGAIVFGSVRALSDQCDVVVMTDADNSVNLGQIGLLIAPHSAGANVVVGDRKHREAVLVKAEARWGPGIVVLRHMQRMVGGALFSRGLRDTQAAFKLYDRAALEDILAAPSTFGFAFDSDWLYGAIAGGHTIERVPFAFIDSFEESASITQGPMTTWESLLKGLVDAARARGVHHDEEMAAVIDRFASAEQLDVIVQQVPPQLDGVDDAALGDPKIMSPRQLRLWLENL